MATPAHFLIRDQNLNILNNGGKTDVTKTDKKGKISGRKALNDISNSRKPSVFQSNKTDKFTNAISTGKDLCAASTTTTYKGVKATEKGKDGGRNALGDITNSVKRPLHHVPKTSGKLGTVAEEENVPISIVDEGFLHNHQECIKAQAKVVDLDFFMKSVGLDNDISMKPSAMVKSSPKKPEKVVKNLDMEEMSEQPFDDQVLKFWRTEISGDCSPACRSPESPKPPYMNWEEESFSDLRVIETPKLMYP